MGSCLEPVSVSGSGKSKPGTLEGQAWLLRGRWVLGKESRVVGYRLWAL